jgi:hypothetical protein
MVYPISFDKHFLITLHDACPTTIINLRFYSQSDLCLETVNGWEEIVATIRVSLDGITRRDQNICTNFYFLKYSLLVTIAVRQIGFTVCHYFGELESSRGREKQTIFTFKIKVGRARLCGLSKGLSRRARKRHLRGMSHAAQGTTNLSSGWAIVPQSAIAS